MSDTVVLDDEARLTAILHELRVGEDLRGYCDHSMSQYHDDDRPGYERQCLLDAQFVLRRWTDETP